MTITVKKIGGSIGVLIPKAIARDMDLAEGTTLALSTRGNTVVMQKASKRTSRRPLKQIIAQIKPASYKRRSREQDEHPLGREIW